MKVAFLLYEYVTALDFVGPYQVLATLPDAEIYLTARKSGPIKTDTGLRLFADISFTDIPQPDILVVPGTSRIDQVTNQASEEAAWLQRVRPGLRWLTSVCTGSLLLGTAGLLQGKRATTHWLAREALRMYGATPVASRVVVDGDIMTAAGVSAGIDMALHLIAQEVGEKVAQISQLRIEYDPAPPYKAGSPETAPAAIVDAAREALLAKHGPHAQNLSIDAVDYGRS